MGISTIKSKLKRGLALTQKESGDLWEYIRSLEKQQRKALEHPELNTSYNGVKSELEPCEDCISRAETINVVHKYFVKYLKVNDDICLDGIRSLSSVTPKARWIPVSERLPEEDGLYLISTCMNCIDTCLFYKDDDEYVWVDYEESVIAWMPLPKSYKAESEE